MNKFHSDIDIGLSGIFEYPRNTRIRGHAYELSILLCLKKVKKSSFAVRGVNIWNSIPAETLAFNKLETFKAQLDRHLGDRLYEISKYHRKKTSSSISFEETQPVL